MVSTKVHQRALDEKAQLEGANRELSRRCDAQQTLIDFLCERINQSEKERAVLLRQITHLDIPIPEIKRRPDTIDEMAQVVAALNRPDLFGDHGADTVTD